MFIAAPLYLTGEKLYPCSVLTRHEHPLDHGSPKRPWTRGPEARTIMGAAATPFGSSSEGRPVEYLVTMTTQVPAGTPEADVQEIRDRESARSKVLAAQGP